jgi:hypothetical protein
MGRDGCPRALDLRGVDGHDHRRVLPSTIRHGPVEPVVAWLTSLPEPVRCCYEAGPTGFGLYRAAVAAGIECQVIAPSKTPRPPGDRHKSDRRDTDLLLRQLMAGALTAVVAPSVSLEAARDLARAREHVRVDLMRCRHPLSKLLLRHGRVYEASAWTKTHRHWLAPRCLSSSSMPFRRRCRPRSKRVSSRSKASNVSLAVSRGHTDREEGVGVRVGAGAELRLVPLAQLRAGGVVTRPLSRARLVT